MEYETNETLITNKYKENESVLRINYNTSETQYKTYISSLQIENKKLVKNLDTNHTAHTNRLVKLNEIIKNLTMKLKDSRYWKEIARTLAITSIQTCAGALTIPEFQINKKTLLDIAEHVHGHNSLLSPFNNNHYDVLEFLRANSMKGNVLVNKELLSSVLLISKVSVV